MSDDDDREPWFRMDADVCEDGAVAMLAQTFGPVAVATWTALLALTKQQQRLGDVTTSIAGIAGRIGDRDVLPELERRRLLWQGLVDLGLVRVVAGDLAGGEVTLHVISWRRKQTMTNAEKQRLKRIRAKKQSDTKAVSVTPISVSATPESTFSTHRQENGEEGIGTDVPPVPLPDIDVASPAELTPPSQPADQVDGPATIRAVFDAWRTTFDVNANAKLDDKRRRRIRWALKEYGKAAVWQCIQGYRADRWEGRMERLTNHDVSLLFRDAAHVERGIELFETEVIPARRRAEGIQVVNEDYLAKRREQMEREHRERAGE